MRTIIFSIFLAACKPSEIKPISDTSAVSDTSTSGDTSVGDSDTSPAEDTVEDSGAVGAVAYEEWDGVTGPISCDTITARDGVVLSDTGLMTKISLVLMHEGNPQSVALLRLVTTDGPIVYSGSCPSGYGLILLYDWDEDGE